MRKAVISVALLLVFTTSVFGSEKKVKGKAKSNSETSANVKNDEFAVTVIPVGNMPPLIKGLSAAKEAENIKKIEESTTKIVEYSRSIQTTREQFKSLYNEMNASMDHVSQKLGTLQEQDKKDFMLASLKAMKYNEFAEKMVLGQDKQLTDFHAKIKNFDSGLVSNGKALNQFIYIETNTRKHAVAMEKAFQKYVATVNEWNSVIKSFGLDI